MGNRAVIATEKKDLGIYLHWQGGRDSVEGFLEFCKRKNYPSPEYSQEGWARLIQVISNFMGSSVYVGLYNELDTDNFDNGVYIIKNWKIVDRLFHEGAEQQEYPLEDFVKELNSKQPENFRLSEDQLPKLFTPENIKRFEEKTILSGGEGLNNWESNCRVEVVGKKLKITTWDTEDNPIEEQYIVLNARDHNEDIIMLENMYGDICYLY